MGLSAGNPADAVQLTPVVLESVVHTSVLPVQVTADDGYTSGKNREALQALGVKEVVFSGAKGRKITPIDEWESESGVRARNGRSAIESLMFTLKFVYEFGCLRRRGLEAVRAELLEKVIAYNFRRMTQVREALAQAGRRKAQARVA